MDTGDLLADAFGRVGDVVHQAVAGCDARGLAFRPDPDANSIAWLVWHLTRVQDDHVSEIAGREQAWATQRWAGFPFDRGDTGFGHTSEQVGRIRPEGPEPLLDYHATVSKRTQRYLQGIDGAELDRIIDASYDPPVSVGIRLVSVISDNLQHAGQARYVRGIVDRTV